MPDYELNSSSEEGMKHKGNTSDTQFDRDREIISMFIRLKNTCRYASVGEICREMAGMQVSQHYISEERAYTLVHHYITSGKILGCSSWKKKMYKSLINKCVELRKNGKTDLLSTVRIAIDSPSCLGVSPNRIQKILRKGGMK